MPMRTLFGRPFGGSKTAVGKFVPNAAENEDDQTEDETAETEEDQTEEDKAETEDEPEDDAEMDDEDDEDASAHVPTGSVSCADIASVMSHFDMPAGAAVALEALVEGVSPAAALRMGQAANGGSNTTATRGADHARRRSARPKMPLAGAGSSDKSARRSSRLRENIARAQGEKTKG